MKKCTLLKLMMGLSFGYVCPVSADIGDAVRSAGPLYVKNLAPATGLLGLPSQRNANTLQVGSFAFALHSSIANNYFVDSTPTALLNLDGETLRFTLDMRYGFADNWDIQLEVPWLDHSGGYLDQLIDNWHDFWGIPDGGRPDVTRDMLNYSYLNPSEIFSLSDDSSGLGDISLSLTHSLYREGNTVVSAVGGYKFATGDEDKLLGSGEGDAYLALRFSGAHLSDIPLSWHGQLGYLYAGSSDVLGPGQQNHLWFAGVSMDWAITRKFSLIVQLDSNAAPMDSDLAALGDVALLGTLGGRWHFVENWAFDFSLVEDLQVGTAPDITFQASIRYQGGKHRP